MANSKSIKTPAQLGSALRERRNQLGKSQASIARKAGISRAWLMALESGMSGVSIGVILRVMNALGLQLQTASPEAAQTLRVPPISNFRQVDLNNVFRTLRNPEK